MDKQATLRETAGMTALEAAQKKFDEAKEIYLSLVRDGKPLSRTMAQQAKIEAAWLDIEAARDWLSFQKNEERNVLRRTA